MLILEIFFCQFFSYIWTDLAFYLFSFFTLFCYYLLVNLVPLIGKRKLDPFNLQQISLSLQKLQQKEESESPDSRPCRSKEKEPPRNHSRERIDPTIIRINISGTLQNTKTLMVRVQRDYGY